MLKEKRQSLNKELLEQWIKDYHWMVNTVKEIRISFDIIGAKTAKYGIEATLPKVVGNSDPILSEVNRRENHMKRIKEYEYKIMEVQNRVSRINSDRESEILFWLLEGKSLRWIGERMCLSTSTIYRLKENIILLMLN